MSRSREPDADVDVARHDASGVARSTGGSIGGATPATRRALTALLNASPWQGGIARWACPSDASPAFDGPADAVVAIPARDERARVAACLDACAHAASFSGLRVHLVLLVNGTRDDTVERALRWSLGRRRPVTIVDVDFVPSLAHAGAARRLAFEIAGLGTAPDTPLLTTDADALPGPAWIAANVERLGAGAALVCGRITPDPDEALGLSARTRAVGGLEVRYRHAMLELEHRLDPDPWNPWPHHGTASGASLAIRAGDLRAIGGAPLVPCAEDRALARETRARGLPVVHADEVVVEVSCRTAGRATGGMADALRRRRHDPNPPCDEALEPAETLLSRLLDRARTRAAWRSPEARRDALAVLGIEPALVTELAGVDAFESAWDRVERALHVPGRTRLHVEALGRELPRLLALLDAVREGADTGPGEGPDRPPLVARRPAPAPAPAPERFRGTARPPSAALEEETS